jgi:hypothetical protein
MRDGLRFPISYNGDVFPRANLVLIVMAKEKNQINLKAFAMHSVGSASIIICVTVKNLNKTSWRDPGGRDSVLPSGSFFLL